MYVTFGAFWLLWCVTLLSGIGLGLLVAGLIDHFAHDRDQQQRQEAAALAPQAARRAHDSVDEVLACSMCWQQQHPGQRWPADWGVALCGEHYAHLLLMKFGRRWQSHASSMHLETTGQRPTLDPL